jgi:hypothetical protein
MALLLCDSIGKILSWPCRVCCEGTRFGCDAMCRACTSPFFPYLAVTCALNLPPTVWGLSALFNNCQVDWLPINAIATALHMLGAWYIVARIQQEHLEDDFKVVVPDLEGGKPTKQTPFKKVSEATMNVTSSAKGSLSSALHLTSPNEGRSNSVPRLVQVLCYDIGVAVYIVVFVAWMIWIAIGSSHIFGNVGIDDWEGHVCGKAGKWVRNSVILGWIYMWLVCCSFCCSLICVRPV